MKYGGVPARKISTLELFAEKCLEETPVYSEEEYIKDRKNEIRRLYEK